MARAAAMNDDHALVLFFLAARSVQILSLLTRVSWKTKPPRMKARHFDAVPTLVFGGVAIFLVTEVLTLA